MAIPIMLGHHHIELFNDVLNDIRIGVLIDHHSSRSMRYENIADTIYHATPSYDVIY